MHEYLRRINLAFEKGMMEHDGFWESEIQHDDWCGVFKNEKCNCDPIIIIKTPDGKVRKLLHDGTLEPLH